MHGVNWECNLKFEANFCGLMVSNSAEERIDQKREKTK